MPGQQNLWAIIPAAGIGTRMQTEIPKQYLKIHDKYILEYVLERFCFHASIKGIVVALAEQDNYWSKMAISRNDKIMTTIGGKERCHSVLNCLNYLKSYADQADWVLVHDAARPCIRQDDINKLIKEVVEHDVGGILATTVRDTMKRSGQGNVIESTVDRESLWHALTPQMFRLEDLRKALATVIEEKMYVTDEAQAMEYFGKKPLLVQGHPDNIKITLQSDLPLAELFLSQQETAA